MQCLYLCVFTMCGIANTWYLMFVSLCVYNAFCDVHYLMCIFLCVMTKIWYEMFVSLCVTMIFVMFIIWCVYFCVWWHKFDMQCLYLCVLTMCGMTKTWYLMFVSLCVDNVFCDVHCLMCIFLCDNQNLILNVCISVCLQCVGWPRHDI